ncbi:MAG: SDR family NAD(P)-dependent oxidoreductase [Pseudomonadota bacterium]
MSKKPVCIVTGVGPGTGTALVRRFAGEGYQVAMLARSAERLEILEQDIEEATAFPCDITDAEQLASVIGHVRDSLGPARVVIHNAVGGAFGTFREITSELLEQNFRINSVALLNLAKLVVDDMIDAGHGVILCTGNTSAYRGKAAFAGFAPTKAAQRILLESIARDVGPLGVHAAFIAIDAVIDVPWTRERFPDKPDDFFSHPDDIAQVCFDVAQQPRSTWASELVIRPFGENW